MTRWLSSLMLGGGVLLGVLLASCGGGTDVAGVGSGGSGLAGGTVSGFGSVYVDGVEIDDSRALQVTEQADGRFDAVVLKLGQRIVVQRAADGAASRLTVEPAVVGPVTAIDAQGLTVLGQRVRVEGDSARGPLTVFGGGVVSLGEIVVGDLVEVHGTREASGALLATRVDRRSDAPHWVIAGPVASVLPAEGEMTIGAQRISLSRASVTPGLAQLETGVQARVWADPVPAVNGRLAAVRVRVAPPVLGEVRTGQGVQYAGVVSAYDAATGTLRIDGVPIRLTATTVVEPATAALASGAYARVEGTWSADGALDASRVRVQGAAVELGQVVLAGVIASSRDSASFVVRAVAVDASGITPSCSGLSPGVGTYVEVLAARQTGTDVVKALSLSCKPAAMVPPGAVREVQGVARQVDAANGTLTLTLADGTGQPVRWDDRTVLLGVQPSGLPGATLIASGVIDGVTGVLQARELRLPGTREADRFNPASGGGGWSAYDQVFRPERLPSATPAPARSGSP